MTLITRLLDRPSMFDHPVRAYGVAATLVAFAILVRFLLAPVEAGIPFVTLFPAVILACFLGGTGPAVFGALLACIAGSYFFMPPFFTAMVDGKNLWGPASFLIAAGIGCVPVDLLRRTVRALSRVTEAQHASEVRFRLAARAAVGVVYDWNPRTGETFRSEGLVDVVGYGPDELRAKWEGWYARVHPDDRDRISAAMKVVLAGDGDHYAFEYRVRHRSGRWVDVWDRGWIVRDDAGSATRVVGTTIDITGRKQMEAELRAAVEQREALLREIHHRVKNSLQTVSSLLSIQARRLDHPGAREDFEDAVARIQAVAMVHQALYQDEDLSRAGIAIQVELLCRHVAAVHGRGVDAIRCDVGAGDAWLPADSLVPFALVVNELLTNAFKHAFAPGEDGIVDVRVSLAGGMVRLEVEDNGNGLPQDFDAADSDTIGMKLVLMFVRQLGGEFLVQRLGRGTRFVVVVPVMLVDTGLAA